MNTQASDDNAKRPTRSVYIPPDISWAEATEILQKIDDHAVIEWRFEGGEMRVDTTEPSTVIAAFTEYVGKYYPIRDEDLEPPKFSLEGRL